MRLIVEYCRPWPVDLEQALAVFQVSTVNDRIALCAPGTKSETEPGHRWRLCLNRGQSFFRRDVRLVCA